MERELRTFAPWGLTSFINQYTLHHDTCSNLIIEYFITRTNASSEIKRFKRAPLCNGSCAPFTCCSFDARLHESLQVYYHRPSVVVHMLYL